MTRWLIPFCLLAVTLLPATPAAAEMHPGLGRFMQRDPAGYADGMSLFEYVTSNPVITGDASGKVSVVLFAWQIKCISDIVSQYATTPAPPGWVGANASNDDWAHCHVGCMINMVCGGNLGAGAGWGKEIWEGIGGRGDPTMRDVANTLIGAGCGLAGSAPGMGWMCRALMPRAAKESLCTECCLNANRMGLTQ
jgi:hypothetical protein